MMQPTSNLCYFCGKDPSYLPTWKEHEGLKLERQMHWIMIETEQRTREAVAVCRGCHTKLGRIARS